MMLGYSAILPYFNRLKLVHCFHTRCGSEITLLFHLLFWVIRLMKPYLHHGSISDRQKNYNYRYSRARMVVENAFCHLKGRWRCLLKRNDTATDNVPTLIMACCVLHNVCKVHKEQFDNSWLEDVNFDPPHEASASHNQPANSSTAEAITHAICYYMNP